MNRHIQMSNKLKTDDLDWDLARKIGLSRREADLLPYFADVEGQTVFYMLELLKLKVARDTDTCAFATIWNYEEFYHCQAFSRLLAECGEKTSLVADVRSKVTIMAKIEDYGQRFLSWAFPKAFVSLWMMWGASQELLTVRSYEALAKSTKNPVLETLCMRIAKQERRHFAWYYNNAKERLSESKFSQWFAKTMFSKFWTPVGEGVKSREEVEDVVRQLLPGQLMHVVAADMDTKLGALPGMEGFDVVRRFAKKIAGPPLAKYDDDDQGEQKEHLARAS